MEVGATHVLVIGSFQQLSVMEKLTNKQTNKVGQPQYWGTTAMNKWYFKLI